MQGDYCLPDLTLPTKEERPIGVWGQRRLRAGVLGRAIEGDEIRHRALQGAGQACPCLFEKVIEIRTNKCLQTTKSHHGKNSTDRVQ